MFYNIYKAGQRGVADGEAAVLRPAADGNHDRLKVFMKTNKFEIVDLTMENIDDLGMFCLKTKRKSPGYQNKLKWLEDRFQEGLKYKLLLVDEGKKDLVSRGFVEYIPGEFAWRGVDAPGYAFIHCIWVIGRHKGQGYGQKLLKTCLEDSKGTHGIAVLTSPKGHWLPRNSLFLKNGFTRVDASPLGFELLALKFAKHAPAPKINPPQEKETNYGPGVTVLTTGQCPYLPDAADLFESVARDLGLPYQQVVLKTPGEAQNNGFCPHGAFAVLYNGRFITHKHERREKFKALLENMMK